MFDPTDLDDVAAGFERRADELDSIRDRVGSVVGDLDWQGDRADRFRNRWADRRGDFKERSAELRAVAKAIRGLADDVRRVLVFIAGIEKAVREFFSDLAAAVEHAARAAGDVGEALFAAVTGRPGKAINELKQAVGHVLDALPWSEDSLPPPGSHDWFKVDDDLSGRGQDGVYYASKGRPWAA